MNPTWGQIAGSGIGVMMFALLLWFILKLQPSLEKIKLRDLDVREMEAKSRVEQAASITQLASSSAQLGVGVGEMSRVLENVTTETRKSIEIVEILQRANSYTQDHLSDSVKELSLRLDIMERAEKKTNAEETRTGNSAN